MDQSESLYFQRLTWIELRIWAGEKACDRGIAYQQENRIGSLAVPPQGGICGTVQGSRLYSTSVSVLNDRLVSVCDCPVESRCKHAVALILEYLAQLKKARPVPPTPPANPAPSDPVDGTPPPSSGTASALPSEPKPENRSWVEADYPSPRLDTLKKLHGFLAKQKPEQWLLLLQNIVERFPDAREYLTDYCNISAGNVYQLVEDTRSQITALVESADWLNSTAGNTPSLSFLEIGSRLEMLLSAGYSDVVLDLGQYLLRTANQHLEEYFDEDRTAGEIKGCLPVVFRALPASGLSPVDQIVWVATAVIEDKHGLIDHPDEIWNQDYPAEAWSQAADHLREQLNRTAEPDPEQAAQVRERDRLTDWLIRSLEEAARPDEILPLCRREAVITDSYIRLVDRLIFEHRLEEAEEWCIQGVKATRVKKPLISRQLREKYRQVQEIREDWPLVAAFRADDYLARPTRKAYLSLQPLCERAAVWPAVRSALLGYLETGQLPEPPEWPLPEISLTEPLRARPADFPLIDSLMDIALLENNLPEIVRWYDYYLEHRPHSSGYLNQGWFREDEIAEALVPVYPERSLRIWQQLTENHLSPNQPVEGVTFYLIKIRALLLRLGRSEEWQDYLAALRAAHRRKKSLLRALDELAGPSIFES